MANFPLTKPLFRLRWETTNYYTFNCYQNLGEIIRILGRREFEVKFTFFPTMTHNNCCYVTTQAVLSPQVRFFGRSRTLSRGPTSPSLTLSFELLFFVETRLGLPSTALFFSINRRWKGWRFETLLPRYVLFQGRREFRVLTKYRNRNVVK